MLPIPHVPPGASIAEADFQRELWRAVNAPGRPTRVFRQNAGAVTTRDRAGRVTGRFHGAATGAADLSGIASVVIAGRTLGLRLEIEVKVDHAHTEEQQAFQAQCDRMGAVYILVRYDHSKTLEANVHDGVKAVDAAIAANVGA